jgi:hypothetical protein
MIKLQCSFRLKDFSIIFLFQVTVPAIIRKGDFILLDNEPDDLWVFILSITYNIRVEPQCVEVKK